MVYDYGFIEREIAGFARVFPIGTTLGGRRLYCIPLGRGKRRAVFAAAFHALEYLTAPALLYAAKALKDYSGCRLFFIPMMNPDGTEIVLHGLNPKDKMHRDIIKTNGIIDYGHIWQANAAGVDINHNFDANWSRVLEKPAPSKFGGPYPESEAETRALTAFLRAIKPDMFMAFHSQGKEIYYDFDGMESEGAKAAAETIGAASGYRVCRPTGTAAFGGAKDWFIKEFHKRAYTIELGCGKNPLPLSELARAEKDCLTICETALTVM